MTAQREFPSESGWWTFTVDTQLPRLPYMTRLDVFFLISTLLVFFALIEVLVTTILDNNQQTARAKKIDRYCRAVFPAIFAVASIAIFAHPRGRSEMKARQFVRARAGKIGRT